MSHLPLEQFSSRISYLVLFPNRLPANRR